MHPTPNRWLTPSAYTLIILAMFLPFCHFKCGGVKMASVQGFDMIVKGNISPSPMIEGLGNRGVMRRGMDRVLDRDELKAKMNIWVVLVAVAAIAGLGVFFANVRPQRIIQLGIAIAGIVFLLAFVITKKQFFELDKLRDGGDTRGSQLDGIISIGLGVGFWLCAAGFAVSAIFNMKDRSPARLPIEEIGEGRVI